MIALKSVLSAWLEEVEATKRDPDSSGGVLPPGEKKPAMVVLLRFFSLGEMTPLLPSGSCLAAQAYTNQFTLLVLIDFCPI